MSHSYSQTHKGWNASVHHGWADGWHTLENPDIWGWLNPICSGGSWSPHLSMVPLQEGVRPVRIPSMQWVYNKHLRPFTKSRDIPMCYIQVLWLGYTERMETHVHNWSTIQTPWDYVCHWHSISIMFRARPYIEQHLATVTRSLSGRLPSRMDHNCCFLKM